MIRQLFPLSLDVLQQSLDLRQQRQGVLSSNIANVETPGFIAKELHFEEALRAAAHPAEQGPLRRTHPRHFPPQIPSIRDVQGHLTTRLSHDVGRDLNTVSIDREMAALTTNTLHYNASANILGRLFSGLRWIINEGRP